ncbi:MAG TPA: hypothetical protein VH137_09655, partial [Gemmatimonadales bacterium]|nr:hypothetical protein [Gemmatimonadales bacterium]
MAQLGVELGSRAVRAVRIDTWPKARTRAVEIEWNRNAPDDLVEALRPLGAARRIAVAVDLPLLYTKRVKLPTLPAAERRKILQLEPERFFAVRARDLVCAVSATDDLVFATPETALAGWVAALEQLAPVDLVEPMPAALARALARARLRDAHILLDARDEGVGLVEIRGGRVAHARRLFGDLAAVARALAADAAPTTIYLSPWDDSRGRALQSLLPAV